ncbi:DUF1604-domain-containing protein [Dacryopinax primogenitus]|uniref:DUF1604-domain-containing protein n=1 Tax=Dacryopinax primogenitus (strain DJM 731) TaxID=1858805 RepID=M5G0B7_DACPD|nr:DUF1604-domain-containing protein [Dacryopinax primogenitus]EJU03681.1 DUF1604-domain-containing protein [Dacryopinax primogenitus]
MTSRLKRKLDNMGVDMSHGTENFCMIGTPLPSLDKADKNEFVPVWKQDVRDEKGRRRLHGAFTGGFSAGYFNTVGSKEGWTPSTFVSSRASRANAPRTQRPEDFMDEEDLEEMRADQQLVDTTHTEGMHFAGEGSVSDDKAIWNALVPSVQDSPGAKLLQKMGWRSGQGIGPRITYAKRRAQDRLAGINVGGDEEMDEEAGKHLYAPRDTPVEVYRAKEDSFGLGYMPGEGLREKSSAKRKREEEGPNISSGFGLGALNDADEDDLDVYEGARRATDKRRHAFSMDEDEDQRVLLGSQQDSSFRRPGQVTGKPPQVQEYFPDGQPVLPGFMPAGSQLTEDAWFAPPQVPENWQADPTRVWEANGSVKVLVPPPKGKDGRPTQLKAEERGAILGEAPLAPRSVFDFMSKEAKERLQKARDSVKTHPAEVKREPSPPPEVKMEIPNLDSTTAAAALRGYQPFTADAVKQRRYTAYLQMQLSGSEPPPELSPLPGQNMDSFNKEVEDYAKAARIFKPVIGAMASRFTSSSTVEVDTKPREGLHAPDQGEYLEQQEEETKLEVKETPKQHAARMGMFGPLTRETSVWQPAKLLCKRFGVRDPYPTGATLEDKAAVASSWTAAEASAAASQVLAVAAVSTKPISEKENVPAKKDISNVGLGEDDDQGRNILTYEKPGMDIFKAIFASDDEDSDEEEETAPPVPAQKMSESQPLEQLVNQSAAPTVMPQASSSAAYEPSSVDTSNALDITSFKPTFVPKSDRNKEEENGDKSARKGKKDKKKKEQRTLISFDAEEGITVKTMPDEDRSKKRKREEKEKSKDRDRHKEKEERRKRRRAEEEEDGMWVEKPPPEIAVTTAAAKEVTPEAGAESVRKRASDFF